MLASQDLVLTISEQLARDIREALFTEDGCENFGVLLCGSAIDDASGHRLLAREWLPAPRDAYHKRLPYHLEIAPSFLNRVVDRSLVRGLSPVVVHSHPLALHAEYSLSDDFGEGRLLPVLEQLLPNRTPASLLVTSQEIRGRILVGGTFVPMDSVTVVGQAVRRYSPRDKQPRACSDPDVDLFDRQVRAIGADGQATLRALRVAIIGLGGTGSAVAEQLVRLGVLNLILVDPDSVDPTNLSRLWGSSPRHVGQLKVDVVRSHLQDISPAVAIQTISDTVVRQGVLGRLRHRDMVFACTDNHWSRAVLNRFAHQYLIPVVDMGVRLDARSGTVRAVGGQISLVGAGLCCLRCSRLISSEQVRAEAMPAAERNELAREGYVQGLSDPEPAIVSLNSTVAGMAVTSGVSMFTSLLGGHSPRQLRYDAARGMVFPVEVRHDDGCDVCSDSDGVKGLGDLQAVSAYD